MNSETAKHGPETDTRMQADAPLPPRVQIVVDILAEVIARRVRESDAKAEQS
jgi:hypothetical protein